jgi:tetratricopeptide (TPR) repeat protein
MFSRPEPPGTPPTPSLVGALLVGAVLVGAGCAARTPPVELGAAVEGPRVIQMDELRIQPAPDPLTGLDTYDAADLLAKGNQLYDAGDHDHALKVFDRLLTSFPDATQVPLALYNAGLALEGLAEDEKATERYGDLLRRFPELEVARDAHYRLSIVLSKLGRWQAVADTFWAARQRKDLSTMDELEARVGLGIAMFMMDDYDTAEKELNGALRFHEDKSKQEPLPATYWVGQARFYVGEINARRFEKIALKSTHEGGERWKDDMATLLEEKCALLLRAQNNFIRTIRVGHAGWATAAGYRIGSMYERLYDEMVGVDAPGDLPESAKPVYDELLREKIGVLVTKAIEVYERSLEMATRVGEKNEWVDKTSKSLEKMRSLALAAMRG